MLWVEFDVTTPLSLPAPQAETPAAQAGPAEVSQAAPSPAAVPEPSTLGLIGVGLGLVDVFRLRKQVSARR